VGPVLGSVLVFASTSGSPTKAALYLATYAFGLTLPLIAISLVAPLALRLLDRAKRHLLPAHPKFARARVIQGVTAI
jgi:cytochrome c-type biogenesis protein